MGMFQLGDESSSSAFKAGVNMHVELAKNLRERVELPEGCFEEFMDSSSEHDE